MVKPSCLLLLFGRILPAFGAIGINAASYHPFSALAAPAAAADRAGFGASFRLLTKGANSRPFQDFSLTPSHGLILLLV
jgi:hypothetical protein